MLPFATVCSVELGNGIISCDLRNMPNSTSPNKQPRARKAAQLRRVTSVLFPYLKDLSHLEAALANVHSTGG